MICMIKVVENVNFDFLKLFSPSEKVMNLCVPVAKVPFMNVNMDTRPATTL